MRKSRQEAGGEGGRFGDLGLSQIFLSVVGAWAALPEEVFCGTSEVRALFGCVFRKSLSRV